MTTTPQPSQAFQSTATKPATNRELPLPQSDTGLESNSADVGIGEAMLTMQTERGKQAIIGEAFRLLRAGGTYSIHELGLQPDNLDESVKDEVRKPEA